MTRDSSLTPLFDNVESAPGFLLWQIEMCWQRSVNQALSSFDLTYTQFIVLFISESLTLKNKHVYQHQVARFSRIDRMMTSRILSSLEKKQFIERDKLSGDARAKLVILTEKGKEVLQRSLKAVSAAEEGFFKPAGPDFVKNMQDILSDCTAV
ncbi:MarR family winged helix-turn-helix transcriptional regulator [Pedobacter sp. SYSU D00535]|uniref:MarR family winged helix-turn-helix transcriptional regulator n=1 Tax=Pedobacter sp. SYSU D00535 TaxID=2810308 RepID=UPI001A96C4F8|nr:MarR family transcriptional regulator [Pedobacter sp. SYSU D00535]